MIEAYLRDTLDEEDQEVYIIKEMALDLWRIIRTARRPVKDSSWMK